MNIDLEMNVNNSPMWEWEAITFNGNVAHIPSSLDCNQLDVKYLFSGNIPFHFAFVMGRSRSIRQIVALYFMGFDIHTYREIGIHIFW